MHVMKLSMQVNSPELAIVCEGLPLPCPSLSVLHPFPSVLHPSLPLWHLSLSVLHPSPSASSLPPAWWGAHRGPQSGPSYFPIVGAVLVSRAVVREYCVSSVWSAALEGADLPVVGGVAGCTHPVAQPLCGQGDGHDSQDQGRYGDEDLLETPGICLLQYYNTSNMPVNSGLVLYV